MKTIAATLLTCCVITAGCAAELDTEEGVARTTSELTGCTIGDHYPTTGSGYIEVSVCDGLVCTMSCSLTNGVNVCLSNTQRCFAPECVTPPYFRFNAGWPGITEATCKARGACWDSRFTDPRGPWCYEKNTDPLTCDTSNQQARVAAGWPGISAQTCVQDLGACWDNRIPGVPWCYLKRPRR